MITSDFIAFLLIKCASALSSYYNYSYGCIQACPCFTLKKTAVIIHILRGVVQQKISQLLKEQIDERREKLDRLAKPRKSLKVLITSQSIHTDSIIPEKVKYITCIRFPFSGIISLGDSAASLSAGGWITIF